jgi:hypothetical protein
VRLEGLGKLEKKIIRRIASRIRDRLAYSIVNQRVCYHDPRIIGYSNLLNLLKFVFSYRATSFQLNKWILSDGPG